MKPAHRILAVAILAACAAQARAQACYTITIVPSAGSGGGCLNLDVATDGCSLVTATGAWFCLCPFIPGGINVLSWAMAIGVQSTLVTVPGVSGLLAVVPDVVVDLTPGAGHFGALLPPPPALTGFSCFIQFAALTHGTGGCFYPYTWELSDAFQVSFL